ncbi:MAG: serine/threonine protein kinase [Bacteroidales bacterium]|nr:serine/threonine protein kinase [Bacteroidales bacterium]
MELANGQTLKNGEYRICKVLGQGGFGVTYLAEQVSLGRKVAIKEFFMKDYCERDEETALVTLGTKSNKDLVERFRQKFIKEARMIASLNNQHIVKIHDIFEENGTAYYVMEYYGGGSLKDVVSRRGALPEHEAVKYVSEISDALKYVHNRNMLHLDIKPSNILLDENGRCILIDFGISKCYDDDGEQTSSTPVGKSKGYAPMEQYVAGGINKFTPATDIYSLGAVLYYLVTGQTPPDANEVYNDGLDSEHLQSVSPAIKAAMVSAMQPRRGDRPDSIDNFMELFNGNNIYSQEFKDEQTCVSEIETTAVITNFEQEISSSKIFVNIWATLLLGGSILMSVGCCNWKGGPYDYLNIVCLFGYLSTAIAAVYMYKMRKTAWFLAGFAIIFGTFPQRWAYPYDDYFLEGGLAVALIQFTLYAFLSLNKTLK